MKSNYFGFANFIKKSFVALATIAFIAGGFFVPKTANATITNLTLIDPTGGELWRGTQNITWTSSIDIGGGNNISILISTNGGTSYSTLVSSISSVLGVYSWNTTTSGAGSLADGNNYRIKLVDPITSIDSSSATNFTDDNTAPITTYTPSIGPDGISGWYVSVPTITLTCNDGAGSGCHKTYYQWDGTGGAWTDYAATPFLALEGDHTLYYYSDDNATDASGIRNIESTQNQNIKVDTNAPTLSVADIVGITIQGSDDTIAITFSEPVIPTDGSWSSNEFDSITGSITGGLTLTNAIFNYSGNTLTITLNKVTDGMYLQNGETITVDPKINAITDPAGNPLSTTAVIGTTATTGDLAVPTVTLTYSSDQTVYKAGDSVTVTATFNESVKAGTAKPKIAIATPGDGDVFPAVDMTIGANDTIWIYTWVVPSGSDDDGIATITITAQDLAGNANAAATNATKLIDNTAPTLGIVLADTALKAGETSLVTFTFSEPVTGFNNTDITTIEGGTLTTVSSSDGGITWTATFTPTVDTTNATNVITVTMTGLTDIAGNAGVGTQSSANYEIDTLRPTVGITSSDYAFKIGDTSTLTFTFSEVPTGFTTDDITAPNGVLSSFTVTGDTKVYTATFTPNADVEAPTNVITVGTGWTDPAGNAPAGSTNSPNYAVDTHRPTVGIVVADDALKAGETSLVTFTFNEVVTGFDNTDLTIANGLLTPVSSSDGGKTWTATFTPTPNFENGINLISVNMAGVADLAGNAGSGTTNSNNYVIDTLLPILTSVSISSNNANTTLAKQGDVVTLTFTASEPIVIPTVTIQGVSADLITNPSGDNWVATRSMNGSDTEGPITFSIDFADNPAGNNGVTVTAVTDGSSVSYDRTNPSVEAGTDKEVNAVVSQDATTSDGGSGIATRAWTKQSGPGTIIFGTPTTEDTTISANTDGTYTLRLTVTDNAGNVGYDEMTFVWDTTRPEPITSSPINGTTGVSIADGTATVTFDEPVTLLDAGRVLLVDDATSVSKKGTVVVSTTPTTLNIPYTGLAYGTKYRINVKPSAVRDVATNVLLSNFISYFTTEIDTIPPVVNSSSAGSITTTGATLSVATDESATCKYSTTDSAYGTMTAFDSPNTGTSHTAVLTSLAPSTSFDYYVRCADTSVQTNAMTTSAHVAFTTLTPDITPPVISNLQVSGITATGATITWSTDENSSTGIEYGLTSSYGGTNSGTGGTTSHSITLSGLTSGSTYHYRVTSVDSATNSAISVDQTFDTVVVPDTTAPAVPVITTSNTTIDANTYVIAGTVADDGGSRTVTIYNGPDVAGSATIPTGDTTWSIVVPLTQETANVFTATASDIVGNTSAPSTSKTITEATATGDTTAPAVPEITTVATTVDASEYTISGTAGADLPSDSTRTITIYRNSNSVTTVVGSITLLSGQTNWSFIAPLAQNTSNTFMAVSTDEAGYSSGASNAVTITETPAADTTAPVISSIHPTSITQTGVTINWTTNESSDTYIDYGLTSDYASSTSSSSMVTSHSKTLTNLLANTTYHYRVKSKDAANNTATSNDYDFTTAINNSAALAVTGIDSVANQNGSTGFATADNTFDNGWRWTFHVTVPSTETTFNMKFADFVSGSNSILAGTNIRFYSAQSSDASASTTAITITTANAYNSTGMTLSSDLSSGTAGRQIDVNVEMRVPISTPGGSYSTSYGVKSENPT